MGHELSLRIIVSDNVNSMFQKFFLNNTGENAHLITQLGTFFTTDLQPDTP